MVTNPDWLRKPTITEFHAAFPAQAMRAGLSGSATLNCVVTTQGLLRDCAVVKENPVGLGFGPAALNLSTFFLMKPATRNGAPIEARITIPVNFDNRSDPIENEDGHTGSHIGGNDIAGRGPGYARTTTVLVMRTAIWAKTPSVADIRAALEKKVGDRFADGKVVFQCSVVKATGALSGCTDVNSSPGMASFQGVAQSLTSKFRVDTAAIASAQEQVRVNLVISFPDMASDVWGQRYLARTQWIREPNFDPKEKLFPKAASTAGLKTGSATVDCVIAANGGLSQCAVIKESNPGVGFGDMARKIAAGFATNPWTEDGLPAEGAHVRMPIQMVDDDPAQQTASAAAKP